MNKPILRNIAALSATTLSLAFSGPGSSETTPPPPCKIFKGSVLKVDDQDRRLTAQGSWFWSTKTFNLGDSGKVLIGVSKKEATLRDLAPGNRVEVQYSSVGGVNVARQIAEQYEQFTGHIVAIDPNTRKLTGEWGPHKMAFTLANDCDILRNDKKASMSELKVGQQVMVTYSPTGRSNLAERVSQRSSSFVGTVEAIDAETRTLKAEHLMTDRKFHMAKDCPIVIHDNPEGRLSDLRIGDTVMFEYENVDGVLVANRIVLERTQEKPKPSHTAQSKVDYPEE